MLRTVRSKARRSVVRALTRFLPAERRHHIERWMRGRDQYQLLRQADLVVVSPGKSGRTWFRVMLSAFFRRHYGLAGDTLLGFDNLHRLDPRIPRVFFTHDNYLKDYTGHRDSKQDFYDKKVILMVRQPQDVVVSEYFNWKYRMNPTKFALNGFPERSEAVSLFDFAMRPCGLDRILDLLNLWAREMPRVKDLLLLRYEDMREDAERELRRVVEFLGLSAEPETLRFAVEQASLENMRRMEQDSGSWLRGGRLRPTDRDNPDSYKVRKAKVGGYQDSFAPAEAERIDGRVRSELAPIYGYGPPGSSA